MGTQVVSEAKRRRLVAAHGWPDFDRIVVGTDPAWAEARLLVLDGHEHYAVNRRTGECDRIPDGDHWTSCGALHPAKQTGDRT